jgi:hypothetical protein
MLRKYIQFYIPLLTLLLLTNCDSGLRPEPDKTSYLKGVVKFVDSYDNWLAADSIKDLRVVAFKNFPPANVLEEVLSGRAYFTMESLPTFVDSANFSIEIKDAPVTLNYIAVAQQFGGLMDWRVVGLYTLIKDSAATLKIEQGKTYNIQMNVDFKNLPKQPFVK